MLLEVAWVDWFEGILFAILAGISVGLTFLIRMHAQRIGMLDVPNARSSHVVPTPRGGGLAIVLATMLGAVVLAWHGSVAPRIAMGLAIPAMLVAAIGFLDDHRGVRALPRFAIHLTAAVAAVALLLPAGSEWTSIAPLRWLSGAVLVFGICWSINLFNFMDGVDGIAGSQALFMSASAAMLAAPGLDATPWATLCVLTAAATLGFLVWNWPPARIFMGDVGSGFLGFWLAVLAIGMHYAGGLSIWTGLILGSVFIADSTVTLLRRIIGGQRWYEAHRSHAYQHLARRWDSHLKVTALAWAINLVFVLPLAYASVRWSPASIWLACVAVLALGAACLAVGAGRPSN